MVNLTYLQPPPACLFYIDTVRVNLTRTDKVKEKGCQKCQSISFFATVRHIHTPNTYTHTHAHARTHTNTHAHTGTEIDTREDQKPSMILDYNATKGGEDNLKKM